MITTILVLAVSSGIISLLILLIPLGDSATELASRGQLSAAVATTFALISGVIAIIVTTMVSSSDYQAEQAVKADTARILSALRSIVMKGTWIRANSPNDMSVLDFTYEKQTINNFLSSTTAFAYWSWVGDKSKLAGSGTPEEWRLFFYYLISIIASKDCNSLISLATEVEKIVAKLEPQDVSHIGSYLNNLANAVSDFERSAEYDPFINATRKVYKGFDEEAARRMLLHIKNKGVKDPNLEILLAMIDGNSTEEELLKLIEDAVSAGTNPNMSYGEFFAKYKEMLKDFDKDKS